MRTAQLYVQPIVCLVAFDEAQLVRVVDMDDRGIKRFLGCLDVRAEHLDRSLQILRNPRHECHLRFNGFARPFPPVFLLAPLHRQPGEIDSFTAHQALFWLMKLSTGR